MKGSYLLDVAFDLQRDFWFHVISIGKVVTEKFTSSLLCGQWSQVPDWSTKLWRQIEFLFVGNHKAQKNGALGSFSPHFLDSQRQFDGCHCEGEFVGSILVCLLLLLWTIQVWKKRQSEGQGLSSTSDLLFIFLPRVAVCPGSKQSITSSSIAKEPLSPIKQAEEHWSSFQRAATFASVIDSRCTLSDSQATISREK